MSDPTQPTAAPEAAPAAPEATPAPAQEPAPKAKRANPYAGPPRAAKAPTAPVAVPAGAAAAPEAPQQPSKNRVVTTLRNQLATAKQELAGVEEMRKALAGYAKTAVDALPAPLQKRVKALAGDNPAKLLEFAQDFAALHSELVPAQSTQAAPSAPANTGPLKPAPVPAAENDPDLAALAEYERLRKSNRFILANQFYAANAKAITRGTAKRSASAN